jgi:putative photosynthetic complex assembly protein 2
MLELTLPVVFAIFIWWFSTGLILLLDGLPKTTFRWSIFLSSGLALLALLGLAHTAGQNSVVGAYCAFTSALLVWGWHELTFLTGWLTGPRKVALDAGCTPTQRFRQALDAILWHELGIVAGGLLIVAITWREPNQVGTWTFLVLWAMRTSAKLNLFFGVRNLNEEFLPQHLAYMGSYFRKRSMNLFLPCAVLISSGVLAYLLNSAFDASASPERSVGLLLVSTLLAMAILEHLLLVLPLPSTALWRWALRNHHQNPVAPDIAKPPLNEDYLHAR